MHIILILLYVFNGVITLETKAFKTPEECVKAGQVRIEQVQKDPRMDGGLYAQCVPSKAQEINKLGMDVNVLLKPF